MNEIKKIKKEKELELEKLKKELGEQQIIALRKILNKLDKDFDKKLGCCLKTPPLKLKELKEQLKKERERAKSHSEVGEKQSSN